MTLKRSSSIKSNGPPRKKAAVDDKKSLGNAKPKAKPIDSKPATEPVRKQPITKTAVDTASASDDDGSDEDVEIGVDEAIEDENLPPMDVDPRPPKDPNASRESHAAQRALQSQRKLAKPNSALIADAKRVWALARQKNIPKNERQKHVADLMDVIKGKVQDVVFKHDASRVVQTVVKYGGQKERDQVALELKGKFKDLAQNKYAKFLVTKLIRYCPTHRASILSEFHTHVLRLLLHREASPIIADAFELYCNASERTLLLRDFYGKEVALFDDAAMNGAAGLEGVLKGADAERRKRTLAALKENLINIFNNPDKGAIPHAILHRALREYLSQVAIMEDEEEKEKARRTVYESCQELIADMVHTKDGSRSIREFLAYGTAKDRKQIIKVLKPHLERMCQDDEAQLVLFTALDVIDDTKMMSKSVISDIISHASVLSTTKAGRRALLYLLVPRTPRHFTPAAIAIISATDAARQQTSKKDASVREAEIRTAASAGLLSFVSSPAEKLCRDPSGSLLVGEIMLYAEGDKSAATAALLDLIRTPYRAADGTGTEVPHVIDLSHTSRLFKTLIQGGHYDRSTSSISTTPSFSPGEFAKQFMEAAGEDNLVHMAKGNGTFVVAELVERITTEGEEGHRRQLAEWFSQDVRADIGNGKTKGSDILLDRLKDLDSNL